MVAHKKMGYTDKKRRRLSEEHKQEEACENPSSKTSTFRRDMGSRTNDLQELVNHNQTTSQVLEVGAICNANNTRVQDSERNRASTDAYIDNKLSSDLIRGPAVCFPKDDTNSKALARNQDEGKDGRFQVPSLDITNFSSRFYTTRNQRNQRVIPITRPNQQHLLLPRTKSKSHIAQNLLQTVLLRPRASIPLDKFSFLEDDIEFLDILNKPFASRGRAIIFRIAAGGRNFAFKVHKYRESEKPYPLQYPQPNPHFDHESAIYARTAHLQHLPSSPIPKCYGYIELTKIPQIPSRGRTLVSAAAYRDFLIQREDRRGNEHRQWKHYFQENPSSTCILRGIVLEEIPSWSLVGKDLAHQPKLESSGREGLACLHKYGIVHNDVNDLCHAIVRNSDRRVIWVGFASSYPYWKGDVQKFKNSVALELDIWARLFPKQSARRRPASSNGRP